MAPTVAMFMSHGCGIKKLNLHLLNKPRTNRAHQVVSAQRRPLWNAKRLHFIRFHRTLLRCRAEHKDSPTVEEKAENISTSTLIWRAIKLPIYTVALIPITVGSAAAYLQTGKYLAKRYVTLLVSSFFVIAWLNLSNDVYDSDTGADKNKKESVVNLLGSQTGTHIVAWVLLALGFMGLTRVSMEAGNLHCLYLLGSAIFCGCIYQCPPFRLSYKGLGEPLCFAAFGPFATTAFYSLQSATREQAISGTVIASSVLVGLTTSLILFCSHFHQIEDDRAVGKMSPLVRLGTETGAKIVKAAITILYSLVFVLGLVGTLPFSSVILCALTIPLGRMVVSFVETNHKDKEKIFMAKYYCVRLHTLFGAALAIGLAGARFFARKQLPHAILL